MELDIQGAKLPTLTQATAYRGILERTQHKTRRTSDENLQLSRTAIKRIMGNVETNAAIWQGIWRKVIKPIIQQFLYRTLHGTHYREM